MSVESFIAIAVAGALLFAYLVWLEVTSWFK